jgi:DNA-binding NarL/FixJ family response regulator
LYTTDVDIIILDIDIGKRTGIEVTEIIREKYPEVKVLILSMIGLHDFVIQALEKGATGYILKNTGKDEVNTAIRYFAKGDSYFSKEVSSIFSRATEQTRNSKNEFRRNYTHFQSSLLFEFTVLFIDLFFLTPSTLLVTFLQIT